MPEKARKAVEEFRELINLILKEMKDDGVNFPIAMKIAKIYKDSAGSTAEGKKKFKDDSPSARRSAMEKAKAMPRKARSKKRKSKKSAESDSK